MDLYAELGVTPQAEPEVIRAAYRALAQRYHPDRLGAPSALGAARMARINHAYSVLSHTEQRRSYDARRNAARRQAPAPVVHLTTTRRSAQTLQPFLTTYDARGRLHAFV